MDTASHGSGLPIPQSRMRSSSQVSSIYRGAAFGRGSVDQGQGYAHPQKVGQGSRGIGSGHGFPPSKAHVSTHPRRMPLQYSPQDIKKRIIHTFKYMCGVVVRTEMEKEMRSLLSEGQRRLHNLFVMTILRQTYSALILQASSTVLSRTRHIPTSYMRRTLDHVQTRRLPRLSEWRRIGRRMQLACMQLNEELENKSVSIKVTDDAVSVLLLATEQYLSRLMFVTHSHVRKLPIPDHVTHSSQEREIKTSSQLSSNLSSPPFNSSSRSFYSSPLQTGIFGYVNRNQKEKRMTKSNDNRYNENDTDNESNVNSFHEKEDAMDISEEENAEEEGDGEGDDDNDVEEQDEDEEQEDEEEEEEETEEHDGSTHSGRGRTTRSLRSSTLRSSTRSKSKAANNPKAKRFAIRKQGKKSGTVMSPLGKRKRDSPKEESEEPMEKAKSPVVDNSKPISTTLTSSINMSSTSVLKTSTTLLRTSSTISTLPVQSNSSNEDNPFSPPIASHTYLPSSYPGVISLDDLLLALSINPEILGLMRDLVFETGYAECGY